MQTKSLFVRGVGSLIALATGLLAGEPQQGQFRPVPPPGRQPEPGQFRPVQPEPGQFRPGPPPDGQPRPARVGRIVDPATGLPMAPDFPRFDLDFKGGTPAELIVSIENALGGPLNVIIPNDLASIELPALKMRDVTVPQLLGAVATATEKITNGALVSYGFRSLSPQGVTPDSIWSFGRVSNNSGPPMYYPPAAIAPAPRPVEPKPALICRVYQLGPFLESYKVEDITTAVQTGWKMLGDPSPPTLNFHKDTKLLIAVGEPERLKLIDSVLEELSADPKKGKRVKANSVPAGLPAGQ